MLTPTVVSDEFPQLSEGLGQHRGVCGAILSLVLLQGLLSASLDCEDAAEGVSEALATCQTKCPVLLLSAAVTDLIVLLWSGGNPAPALRAGVTHYPSV